VSDLPLAPPSLPAPRGPLTRRLFTQLRQAPGPLGLLPTPADPWGDDLQLALYACLELRYRGFAGVDDEWEVEPSLVELQQRLAQAFLRAVAAEVGPVPAHPPTPEEARAEVARLAGWPAPGGDGGSDDSDSGEGDDGGPSLSAWMEASGELQHMREFAVHRSAYQLKEADPHSYALPRLRAGKAKSAYVEVQGDEYGDGRPGASHQELFADTMRGLGLDATYGAYLDAVPAETLATVNLLSAFGTSRRWLGACVGHLALFEMTSVGPMGRYAAAVRRMTGSDEAARFYDVHVVADEHHQRLAADVMVPAFVESEPDQAVGLVFGARALAVVEGRLTALLLDRWGRGLSSLRQPLAASHAA
jgi:hypothetical protein